MVLFGSEDRLGQVLYTLSVRYGLATTRIIGELETRDSLLDRAKIVGKRADIVKLARNLQYRYSKGEIDYLPTGLVVVGGWMQAPSRASANTKDRTYLCCWVGS